MKAERINQDQIRFTLSAGDLQERDIKVSELAYGSEKTKALFHDMVRTARDQFGVDFSEKPLMIEAIPVSENLLTITVTRVTGAAELGALFGSNLPDGRRGQGEEHRPAAARAGEKEEKKQKEAMELPGTGEDVVYVFKNFAQLMQAAQHVSPKIALRNMLYQNQEKGIYYLIVHYKKLDRRVRYMVSVLSQYCESWIVGGRAELIVKEHGRPVIKARAIQKLADVEREDF